MQIKRAAQLAFELENKPKVFLVHGENQPADELHKNKRALWI
jgi:hypothetical protein